MNSFVYRDRLERAAEYLVSRAGVKPLWCVVLGSGLGGFSKLLDETTASVPFTDIPGFPTVTVQGHAGKFTFGKIGKNGVAIQEGRFHFYEGHDPWVVVMPTRVMALLGVQNYFLTNAAGGIRADFKPGDLMLIEDHINLMGMNPLIGANQEAFGPRFPPMLDAYDPAMRTAFLGIAKKGNIELKSGVYVALSGPNYETQAEIRMLRGLGADAVGMSTAPEALAIRHAGRKLIAVSLITNATTAEAPPSHAEVVEVAARRRDDLHALIAQMIRET